MASKTMDEFCGSAFWDVDLSWRTEDPDLTRCFEKTVLVWVPCTFLWTFSLLEVYYIVNSKKRDIPWNVLNVLKSLVTAILLILTVVDIVQAVSSASTEGLPVYNVDIYSPLIKIFTFALTAVFLLYNKKHGLRTSGLLFLFWMLLVIFGAVQFRSEIRRYNKGETEEKQYPFISYMIYYPLIIIMFLLNCFADKAPRISKYPKVENPCPEEGSSFLSRLLFAWFDSLAWTGFRKPLETKDLWSMNPEDCAPEVVPLFDKYWRKTVEKCGSSPAKASFKSGSASVDFQQNTKKKKQASILPALCKAFGPTFMFGAFLKLLQDLLTFVSPQLLKLLISFIEGGESLWKGYTYSVLMLLTATVQTLILSQYFNRMFLVGMRIRTALISAIYRKAMCMSNSARKESTVGEIVNLMSVDAQRFMELTAYLNMIWSAPLQIALALYFLWETLGPSVLAGLTVMIILIPINGYIANKVKTLQIRQMKNKDERVKLMNEVLSGIKVLKLYAWEPSFEAQILKIRNKEIKVLKQAAYMNAATSFIWSCAPFLVSLVSFTMYVYINDIQNLSAQTIFVAIALFHRLHFPMSMLPMTIILFIQAAAATFSTYVLTDDAHILNAQKMFVSLALFDILEFPVTGLPYLIIHIIQVALCTFAVYVCSGNNILTPQKAFVALTLFGIIRMPMSLLPLLIVYCVEVSLVSFATYVLVDEKNVLDAKKAFVSLSLFNILRFPLSMLPMMISNMVQASVSIQRINKFMNSEELNPDNVQHDPSEKYPLIIENGTFTWGEDPILRNINLRFPKGGLVAVVGSVGAGKSSLLSAFLGEMDKQHGRVNTVGSIAYVSQQAWIQNATLHDNILFGKQLDKKLYDRIVEACALKQDFEMLPGGDQTEIGEKGINLSGGQKQRVSLARAVYNDSEIYFLDDPLSAVDSHVGKHIFENVIGPNGILKKKTRVLVTHGITYLPEVDQIVVLKNGEVSEMGTYKELLDKKGDFAEFLIQHLQEVNEDEAEEQLDELKNTLTNSLGPEEIRQKLARHRSRVSESVSETGSTTDRPSMNGSLTRQMSTESGGSLRRRIPEKEDIRKSVSKPGEKLIEVEKTETGSVKWEVYSHYLKSIGITLSVATVVLNMVFQGFSIGSNLWLSVWADDKEIASNHTVNTQKRDMYLGVYGALGIGQAISMFFSSLALYVGTLSGAQLMHDQLLVNVLRAPSTSFFDITPVGRILNRFSKDVDTVDNVLPMTLRGWTTCFFAVIATLFVISFSTPIFVSVIVPIGFIYYFIQRFYVATSRQLKRLESVSRSPIYSHFGESVTGTQTIRAYGVQNRFISESEAKVDFNQVCYYPSIIANRWLAVRLEMVGNLIIFFASLFAVIRRDTMNAGLVGLSVSYALQITQTLNWLVRMTSDVETNIVAVERIKEYGETEQEAPWELQNSKLQTTWPEKGTVDFKNYAVRYRPGLDLVLKGVNFTVNGGEKVGIVGRTGAGKSSLTLALFRIIEASDGEIAIDNVNIATLGLHTLRSRLTIIPQDAVLFSGTLRLNLDPFDSHTDEEVWRALEHAHLKAFVKGLPSGLNHEVTEGGENLSVGQRQLICLGRALLRKTKVLILDEATAAVDLETDDLIQRTIRTEFSECTVLTIAHRLNTILDSDRVIVLDKGQIVEFDAPNNLLQNKNSIFYGMAKDAGLV